MSLAAARRALLAALEAGRYEYEARDTLAEKNLLAIGNVDAAFVALLVRRTRGNQYEAVPHHWDSTVRVHVFKPQFGGERWYVKAYFLPPDETRAVFIGVHR